MKFVPYEKLSKKKKREADRARRGSWGGINPVTRRPDDPKAYKRSERKSEWKRSVSPTMGRRVFLTADNLCGGVPTSKGRAKRGDGESPFFV